MTPSDATLAEAQAKLELKRQRLGVPEQSTTRTEGNLTARNEDALSGSTSATAFDAEDPYATLVPDGLYLVRLRRVDEITVYGRRVWACCFELVDKLVAGKPILRFYNVPSGPRIGRTSNLFLDFARITGRRPPTRGLTPKHFLARGTFLARVVRVEPQDHRRLEDSWLLPACLAYSKIDSLASSGDQPTRLLREGRRSGPLRDSRSGTSEKEKKNPHPIPGPTPVPSPPTETCT